MTRRLALLGSLCALALCALGAAPAAAATVWNLEMHHNQTNFSNSVPGSLEAKTLTEGGPGQNEEQQVSLSAESGEFVLSFEGEATEDLPYNIGKIPLQSALRNLPTIGPGNVKVDREAEGSEVTFDVTFQGDLAEADVPQIEAANGAEPLGLDAHPQYWLDLSNVGDSASAGQVDLTVQLPAGIDFAQAIYGQEFRPPLAELGWSCAGAGTPTAECHTTEGSVPRHTIAHLAIEVEVEPGLPEGSLTATATATVSGGGAAAPASDTEPTPISSAPAGFGIFAPSFRPGFFDADGLTPRRQAAGHPDLLSVPVDFNSIYTDISAEGENVAGEAKQLYRKREAGSVRDLTADLPAGFLGDPTAVGECSQAQFLVGACPPSSQVGRFDGSISTPGAGIVYNFSTGVFNMVHPRGAVTDLAFELNANPVHVKASLDPANRYAITTRLADINETFPPFSGRVTVWGVPADPSHDSERCPGFSSVGGPGHTDQECSAEAPGGGLAPFVTMPAQCEAAGAFRLRDYDSWQRPGLYGPDIPYTLPDRFTGCDKPRFDPDVSLEPTGDRASTPTGLNVSIHVPQNDNPNALATPPVRTTTVTLPEGLTVNPAAAGGLSSCSESEFGISDSGTPNGEPVRCPDSSRLGEAEVKTPLLPDPVEGSVYLAEQEANPFGSLLALYLALHDTEDRGVLVKVPLRISLDPATGQITTTATNLPQFPFSDLTLKFRSGDRAPLLNPPTCGRHELQATMTSYAQPNHEVDVSGSYELREGPGGGPCPASLGERPFEPGFLAGTANPVAGAFSPLIARVTRTDADQELSAAQATAPPGLVASLRGVGRCTEAQIAAAAARSRPGQGALEQASPSCPAAAQIGTVQAGAGAGPAPIYVPGRVYLAGPYKGAPLSGVAIVPAVAGPVDLGNVVVRAPAYLNPRTAQVSLKTDPLPQIVNGVVIRTRDVRIHLDRPGFAINPTNCEPKSIIAALYSSEAKSKVLASRFQVADCANLGFRPRLKLRLKGGTRRGAHPALKAVVVSRWPRDANFAHAIVTLPHSAFLDQAHIRTVCTRVQ